MRLNDVDERNFGSSYDIQIRSLLFILNIKCFTFLLFVFLDSVECH